MHQDNGDLWSAHFFPIIKLCGFPLCSFALGSHCCADQKWLHLKVSSLSFSVTNWLGNLKVVWGTVHQHKGRWKNKWLTAVGQRSVMLQKREWVALSIGPDVTKPVDFICFYPRSKFTTGTRHIPAPMARLSSLLNCALLDTVNQFPCLISPYFDWHIDSFFECIKITTWL